MKKVIFFTKTKEKKTIAPISKVAGTKCVYFHDLQAFSKYQQAKERNNKVTGINF